MTHAALVESITRAAEAEGEPVVGTRLTATGPVTDPVGTADPLAALPAWLAGHVSFLREPLAALRGNPDEINANAAKLRSAARDMADIAAEQRNDDMAALGLALDGMAAMVVISGKLVHTLRAAVFGMVAALVTDLARNALIAAASAAQTNGGSIAVCCAVANARAAATADRIRDRITALTEALGRQAARLAELENLMQGLDYQPVTP